jgi:hypothetical protein
MPNGTGNKPTFCAGCQLPILRREYRFTCCFSTRGFKFTNNTQAIPCHTKYHLRCIRAGPPFRTRLRNGAGLSMPPIRDLPNFICEACTVRAVLDRELQDHSRDHALLMLERIRLIDMCHNWSSGTHTQYQGKLRILRDFETAFGVRVLQATGLDRPPSPPAIPIMWAQQRYALRPGKVRGTETAPTSVTFATVRGLRSAANQFFAWDLQVAYPDTAMKDSSSRAVVTPGCLPTDSLAYVYMSTGMRRRLGDESKPSLALLQRHVRWIDTFLNDAYNNSADPEHRAELARAAIANLAAWLGWLRAMEVFSLRWIDVTVTEPGDGAALDLPPAIGAVSFRLLPQTKSDQSRTADILIAYTTSSNFSIGQWLHRLRVSLGAVELPSDDSLIFQESDGTPWSSLYFRATYLIPLLEMQRRAGDTHLTPFDGSPGNSIADKFWSMSSYRRGGRSHVSRVRVGCIRKATPMEVSEHGRWRHSRSSMDMPTLYLEWTSVDRINVTLLCM